MKKYFFQITVGLLLANFIFLLALVLPKYQEWQQFRLEVKVKQAELKVREDYFANLKKLSQKLNGYPEALAKIDSALPDNPSLPSVLDFLQSQASQNNLVLKRIGLGPISLVSERPPVQRETLSLEVAGSYENFRPMLKIIENSSRLIQVDNLSFSFPEKNNQFIFNLTLGVNFMPESLVTTK